MREQTYLEYSGKRRTLDLRPTIMNCILTFLLFFSADILLDSERLCLCLSFSTALLKRGYFVAVTPLSAPVIFVLYVAFIYPG